MMRILQLSPSQGRLCGVAVFADSMATAMAGAGVGVRTVADVEHDVGEDLVLVHYHHDLVPGERLRALLDRATRPVVLMAHSPVPGHILDRTAGILTMADGLLPGAVAVPGLAFPHPAFTPPTLTDRAATRAGLGLPHGEKIVATSGFLRFDRSFPEVLGRLLPGAAELGWHVHLVTSPWHRPSPGLLDELGRLSDRHAGRLSHVHRHLSEPDLNRHLQAADLLWCWSPPPPEPYASGVVSQMYGSGTRMVVADRPQHEHVLNLPNVVRGPGSLDDFVGEVLSQMRHHHGERHNPAFIDWRRQIRDVVRFLTTLVDRGHTR